MAVAALSVDNENTIPPAGAGAEIERVTVLVPPFEMTVTGLGLRVAVTVTFTGCVSGPNPMAVALTFVVPIRTPVICGLALGVCAPAGMNTLGVIVAFPGTLLVKFTVKPPAGAGCDKLKAILTDWPGATVTPV